MIPALIGLGVGLAGSVGKMFERKSANRRLETIKQSLKENPLYAQQYALAQSMFQAQAPGTQEFIRGAERSRASQIAAAERAGQNPLLTAAAAGAQANEAMQQIAAQQAAYKTSQYGNVAQAGMNLAQEQERIFKERAEIDAMKQENRYNTWGDIANLGFGVANFAAQGGFNRTPKTPIDRTAPLGTQTVGGSSYAPGVTVPTTPNFLNYSAMGTSAAPSYGGMQSPGFINLGMGAYIPANTMTMGYNMFNPFRKS